jgi:glycosyltransferase 2 family protein
MRPAGRHHPLHHPVALAAGAVVGLVGSYLIAIRRPVMQSELDLTTKINQAPDAVAHTLWPVMQLGSVWGPVVVAVAILAFVRDKLLAATVLVTGIVTWFAAKGAKDIVERGRPRAYLPDIVVREGRGTGLGYISGHSAVAAAAAIVAATAVPRKARPVLGILAVAVGMARIVYGVHLPADVIGGWSFGVLMGLGGVEISEQIRHRRDGATAPD